MLVYIKTKLLLNMFNIYLILNLICFMERNKVLQYNELNLRHKIREVLKPVVSFTLSKFKVKIKTIKSNVKL